MRVLRFATCPHDGGHHPLTLTQLCLIEQVPVRRQRHGLRRVADGAGDVQDVLTLGDQETHERVAEVLDSVGGGLLLAVAPQGRALRRISYDDLSVDDGAYDDLLDQIVNRRARLRMERPASGTMGRAW